MKLKFFVGNDNGNSEHDIFVDGRLIRQPNVNADVDQLPWSEDQAPEAFIKQLQDNLVVTVNSPAAKPGMYYIGKFALESGELLNTIQVGVDKKYEVDVPVVNTLAEIAAVAVQKAYEETGVVNEDELIEVEVDMTTALPMNQHTDETAKAFESRFMNGVHDVTVHVAKARIPVKITFDFVKALAEGTPVTFSLQKDRDGKSRTGDIFDEFLNEYKIDKKFDGSYFKEKRVLHVDIGDGTTEYPVTEGNKFDRNFVHGTNHGAGHAIEAALVEFNEIIHLPDSPRQFFSDVVKNPLHKYHDRALKTLEKPLRGQAEQILSNVRKQITKARNEIDIVCVYGGGSILMRDVFYPMLKELCDEREIQLLYIPAKYAVTMNAEGLDIFVRSKIFEALKQKATV